MAWPEDRPVGYNANKYWDETTGTWRTTRVTQPGSYTEYVLVISEEGDIYFRAVI